jgi:phage tail sheath protein FI
MATPLSYPGVYVEEIPSGVRTITGVATSVTAFFGRASRGPLNEAADITSYADFERNFGGLWLDSPMSFAVRDFFLNGGSHAVIVRLFNPSFVSDAERSDAVAAAAKVTDAAKAETTGAAAKTRAAAALATVQGDVGASAAAKGAAARANGIIAGLADGADATAIAAAVARATLVAAPAPRSLDAGTLRFRALSPGKWGGYLRLQVSAASGPAATAVAAQLGLGIADLFNLTVTDTGTGGATETYLNLSVKNSARRVDKVLADSSSLIEWAGDSLDTVTPALPDFTHVKGDPVGTAWQALLDARLAYPDPTDAHVVKAQNDYNDALQAAIASVDDGGLLTTTEFLPQGGQAAKTGLYALEQLYAHDGLFNLLCIPPYNADGDIDAGVREAAIAYCEKRRAMMLIDPPASWKSVASAQQNFPTLLSAPSRNAAFFFPRLQMPNPLRDNQIEVFAPCGVVAGVFARTDAQRGVWKAPAGLDAAMTGVAAFSVPMTDEENGLLNPLGINCLRTFPVFGRVIWGARTTRGADALADEYKYVPVRRTALFIEESLYRALKWVVFEPNDEPLWAQIRLNVGAFMHDLFRQGAFQGASARDAYFVRCDASTTTQNDINLGVVNIRVGFAPLKPAEFVVISLQQIAGQIEA